MRLYFSTLILQNPTVGELHMNLFDSAVTFTPPSQLWIQISWIIQSLMQKQEELIWWHCPFKKWVIHSFCLVNLQLKFFLEKLWLQYCYIWMYFSFSRIFNNNKFEFLLLLGSWFDERNRTKKWWFLMYFESTGDYKFSLHTVCKNSSIIFSAETTCASNGEWTCKCFGPKFLFLFSVSTQWKQLELILLIVTVLHWNKPRTM